MVPTLRQKFLQSHKDTSCVSSSLAGPYRLYPLPGKHSPLLLAPPHSPGVPFAPPCLPESRVQGGEVKGHDLPNT